MFGKFRHLLMRNEYLRKAQWFYKSEPIRFAPIEGANQSCPACAATATHQSDYPSWARPFSRKTVLYCGACGLGFVPEMGPVLAQYYKDEYGRSNRGDRQIDPVMYFRDQVAGNDPALAKYTGRVRRQIDLLKTYNASFENVLDYGSGPGYFLHACGAKAIHAVEPDELSHKYLSHLGATIHVDHMSLPQGAYDTIVASHTIEHLPSEDLRLVLKTLIQALTPSGRLLIEVPQGGHSYLHLAGQRQDPHTLFFTGQSLVSVLRAVGAEIVFQQALGRVESPRRIGGIYVPNGPPFYGTARGSLTLICARANEGY